MTWESWLIAASIAVAAIAFAALVIFLIVTLLSVRSMIKDIDHKVHSFDPLFRVVNKAGNAIERKTSQVKQLSKEFDDEEDEYRECKKQSAVNTAMEVAEWALIGLALIQKVKERKR